MEIRDWLTIAALVIGPISAAVIALWVEAQRRERYQKESRKLDVLYDLVRARAGFNTKRNRDVLESALNAIPVIFRDDDSVCEAHKQAFRAVGSTQFEPLLLDLIRAVCIHMRYSDIDSEVIKGIFFFPDSGSSP